jgi:hypothetical protein
LRDSRWDLLFGVVEAVFELLELDRGLLVRRFCWRGL